MVDICVAVCIVCGTYSHLCKSGCNGCKCKPCYGNKNNNHSADGLGIVLARGETKGIATLSKQNIFFLIISGIATGLSWIFYFKALQTGKVSQVAPVDKLSVALTIILSVVLLGKVMTLKAVVGIVLIIIGTIVLIY